MRPPEHLLALAARCEHSGRPDRALDADIYEALGYTVRRKPAELVSRRAPAGGIYRRGEIWKTLGAVSANIDIGLALLRERAPGWQWRLQSEISEDAAFYEALVDGCSGGAVLGSLALCAAMLRAFARPGAMAPTPRSDSPTPATLTDN